jgi:Spy/CpxP family protein refolding chaperone
MKSSAMSIKRLARILDDSDRFLGKRLIQHFDDRHELLKEISMKLNWKTLTFAIASVGALIVMTAMVVLSQNSQGPQNPDGAGGPPPAERIRRGPGPRDGLGRLARELNLTDEQKARIEKITESFEAATKQLHEQLRSLHESEGSPFTTSFDEAAVRAAAEARAKIEVELQVSRAKMMSQIAGVLTAEQRAQLEAKRPQFPPGPPPSPER